MTFIQPHKNQSFLNKALFLLAIFAVFGVIWLITLYNKEVKLDHAVSQMNAEFQLVQSQNAELKDKIIKLSDSANSINLISRENLIQDKAPQYFEVNKQWSFASQY